ncbi:hypothetical protein [Candidatus Similichlamydia epinepheli]|nr:hypothetical protein [Candidatus Similichlamydia epinepheli]
MQENTWQLQRRGTFCPDQTTTEKKGEEWYVMVTCSDGSDGKLAAKG